MLWRPSSRRPDAAFKLCHLKTPRSTELDAASAVPRALSLFPSCCLSCACPVRERDFRAASRTRGAPPITRRERGVRGERAGPARFSASARPALPPPLRRSLQPPRARALLFPNARYRLPAALRARAARSASRLQCRLCRSALKRVAESQGPGSHGRTAWQRCPRSSPRRVGQRRCLCACCAQRGLLRWWATAGQQRLISNMAMLSSLSVADKPSGHHFSRVPARE